MLLRDVVFKNKHYYYYYYYYYHGIWNYTRNVQKNRNSVEKTHGLTENGNTESEEEHGVRTEA